MQCTTDEHWSMVKWILHYLKHTLDYGIQILSSNYSELSAFFVQTGSVVLMIENHK